MPEFVCRLGAPNGSVLEQRRLAASLDALRRELEGEGFHVFSVTRSGTGFRIPFFTKVDKVKSQDFLIFNTQLRTLLHAGLPLVQSLGLLKDQQTDPKFRAMLEKVHQQVTTGIALSDAFLSLGDAFPRLYANSLKAGERSGDLEEVLARFVEYQKLIEEVRHKIISALTYPLVLSLLAVGLVVILMTFVIPSFSEFYVTFDSALPLPTRLVMNLADFMQNYFVWIIIAGAAGFYAFKVWASSGTGRMIVDRAKLSLPILGRLVHLFAVSQLTRSLAVLLNGGTPMVPALDTAATSISNAFVAEKTLGCVKEVKEGRALSDSLEDTGQIPSLALAMMRVGEATGALPEMLTDCSEFFDREIEFSLQQIVTLFEPAILVVMGLIVAGLLLAVYYPLLTLVTKIG